MREKRELKLAKREAAKLRRVALDRLKTRLSNSCGDECSLEDEVLALSNMTVEISRSGNSGPDKTRDAQLGAATDMLQKKIHALASGFKAVTSRTTFSIFCADCAVKVALAGVDVASIFDDLASMCALTVRNCTFFCIANAYFSLLAG
jgi:hypothetical protein